jgi:hypothetical protein
VCVVSVGKFVCLRMRLVLKIVCVSVVSVGIFVSFSLPFQISAL